MFAAFTNDAEGKDKIKDSIVKMLKNEQTFMNSVDPLPNDFVIKLRLSYYQGKYQKQKSLYFCYFFIHLPFYFS